MMQNNNGTIEISDSLKDVIKQLNEPKTSAALKNIAKNAEVLDVLVSGVDGLIRRGDEITENVGEAVREFSPKANGNGNSALIEEVPQLINNLPILAKTGNKFSAIAETKEFDELLTTDNVKTLKELVGLLNNPETLQALKETLQYAPLLAFLTKGLNDFISRGDEIAENVTEAFNEFKPKSDSETSAELGQILGQLPILLPSLAKNLPTIAENLPPLLENAPSLMKTSVKLGEIADSEGVQAFLNSGMLSPELVSLLGEAGETAIKTHQEFKANPREFSLWGAYKETKDADVQRGLGFLLELSKNLGKMLKK